MTNTSSSKSSLVGFLIVATIFRYVVRVEAKKKSDGISAAFQSSSRSLSEEEKWIEASIKTTMPPADRMGITIEKLNLSMEDDNSQGSLSLSMPLEGNTNVHGSAFAGSLYSLSVLCGWYTLVCYFRALGVADQYVVVVKHAEISYLRPVINQERVVATSFLPNKQTCQDFVARLQETGKTTLNLTGRISIQSTPEEKTAVDYTAVLCAFKPRSTTSSPKK